MDLVQQLHAPDDSLVDSGVLVVDADADAGDKKHGQFALHH